MEELHLFTVSFVADDQQHNAPYFGEIKILYNILLYSRHEFGCNHDKQKDSTKNCITFFKARSQKTSGWKNFIQVQEFYS